MKFKGTTVLLVLFIALGAYVYFAEYRGREAREQKAEAAKKAIQVEPKDITQLTLTYQGMTVTAERKGEKAWVLTAPETVDADSEQLETLASDIARVEREGVVTADAADLKTFGLEPPTNTVLFKTADGKQSELHFGAENPKNRRREIDVATRRFVAPTAAEIRPARDQRVVHVVWTERAVTTVAGAPADVGRDLSGDSEFVRAVVPATGNEDVRRGWRIDLGLRKGEGAFMLFARQDDAGKVGALQEIDQLFDHSLLMIDNIERDASTE